MCVERGWLWSERVGEGGGGREVVEQGMVVSAPAGERESADGLRIRERGGEQWGGWR